MQNRLSTCLHVSDLHWHLPFGFLSALFLANLKQSEFNLLGCQCAAKPFRELKTLLTDERG